MDKTEALLSVLRENGVRVPSTGNVSCPFHEDNSPSMSLDRKRGLYNCHACGRGGDVYSLLEDLKGMSFQEAKESLGGRDTITTSSMDLEPEQTKRLEPVQIGRTEHLETMLRLAENNRTDMFWAYADARGLSKRTVADFRLGIGTRELGVMAGAFLVPYLSPTNRPLQIRSRCITCSGDEHSGHGKYRATAGEQTRMYNARAIVQNPTARSIVVCEGEMDTMSAVQAGYLAVGFPGVNNVKPHHLTILRAFDTVKVVGDNDPRGHEFVEKLMAAIPQAKSVHAQTDVNDALVQGGEVAVRDMIGG